MNADEARKVRREIEETPNIVFLDYGFNRDSEVTVSAMRDDGGHTVTLDSVRSWDNFKGYVKLRIEFNKEREEANSGASS